MRLDIAACVLALVLLIVPSAARADVALPQDPDAMGCFGRTPAEACTMDSGGQGKCEESRCAYPARGPDGGIYTDRCLKCVGNTGSVSSGGCGAASIRSPAKEIGALVVAGSFSLLFLIKRRRRRS